MNIKDILRQLVIKDLQLGEGTELIEFFAHETHIQDNEDLVLQIRENLQLIHRVEYLIIKENLDRLIGLSNNPLLQKIADIVNQHLSNNHTAADELLTAEELVFLESRIAKESVVPTSVKEFLTALRDIHTTRYARTSVGKEKIKTTITLWNRNEEIRSYFRKKGNGVQFTENDLRQFITICMKKNLFDICEAVFDIKSYLTGTEKEKAAAFKNILSTQRTKLIEQISKEDLDWFLAYCPADNKTDAAKAAAQVVAIKSIFSTHCPKLIKQIPKRYIRRFLSYCPADNQTDAAKAAAKATAIKIILHCQCADIIEQIPTDDLLSYIAYCPGDNQTDEAKAGARAVAIKSILSSHCPKIMEHIPEADIIKFIAYCPPGNNADEAKAAAINSILSSHCPEVIKKIPLSEITWYITRYPGNSNAKTADAIESILKSHCSSLIQSLYEIKIDNNNALQWYFNSDIHPAETINARIKFLLTFRRIRLDDKAYLLAFAINYNPDHPLLENTEKKNQSLIKRITAIINFANENKEKVLQFNYEEIPPGIDFPHPLELQKEKSQGTLTLSSEEGERWKELIKKENLNEAGISCVTIRESDQYQLSFDSCTYPTWFKKHSDVTSKTQATESTEPVQITSTMADIDNNNNNNNNVSMQETSEITEQLAVANVTTNNTPLHSIPVPDRVEDSSYSIMDYSSLGSADVTMNEDVSVADIATRNTTPPIMSVADSEDLDQGTFTVNNESNVENTVDTSMNNTATIADANNNNALLLTDILLTAEESAFLDSLITIEESIPQVVKEFLAALRDSQSNRYNKSSREKDKKKAISLWKNHNEIKSYFIEKNGNSEIYTTLTKEDFRHFFTICLKQRLRDICKDIPIEAYLEGTDEEKAAAIRRILISECSDIIKQIPKDDIPWFISYCPGDNRTDEAKDAAKAAAIKSVLRCYCPEITKQIPKDDIDWFLSYCPGDNRTDEAKDAAKAAAIKSILSSECSDIIKQIPKKDIPWFISYCHPGNNADATKAAAIKSVLSCRCFQIIKQIPTSDISWYITRYPGNSNAKRVDAIESILKSLCSSLIQSLYEIKIADHNALQWYFNPDPELHDAETINARINFLLTFTRIRLDDKAYLLAFAINHNPDHPLLQDTAAKNQSLIKRITAIINFANENKETVLQLNYEELPPGIDFPHPLEVQKEKSQGTLTISSEEAEQWKKLIRKENLDKAGIGCKHIKHSDQFLLAFDSRTYLTWYKNHSIVRLSTQATESTERVQTSLSVPDTENNNNNNASRQQTSEITQQPFITDVTTNTTSLLTIPVPDNIEDYSSLGSADVTMNEDASVTDATTDNAFLLTDVLLTAEESAFLDSLIAIEDSIPQSVKEFLAALRDSQSNKYTRSSREKDKNKAISLWKNHEEVRSYFTQRQRADDDNNNINTIFTKEDLRHFFTICLKRRLRDICKDIPIDIYLDCTEAEKAVAIKCILSSLCPDIIKQIPKDDIPWFISYCHPGNNADATKAAAIKSVLSCHCPEIKKQIPKKDIDWFLSYCPPGNNRGAAKAAAIKSVLSCRCPQIIKHLPKRYITEFISYCPPGNNADAAKAVAIQSIFSSECSDIIKQIPKKHIPWFISYCPGDNRTDEAKDEAKAAAINSILTTRCSEIIKLISSSDISWYITRYPGNSNAKTAEVIESILKSHCPLLIHSLYEIKIANNNALQWYFNPDPNLNDAETINTRIKFLLASNRIRLDDKAYLLVFAINYKLDHPLLQNTAEKNRVLIKKITAIIDFASENEEKVLHLNYEELAPGLHLPHPLEVQKEKSQGTLTISSEEAEQWKKLIRKENLKEAGISSKNIKNSDQVLLAFDSCTYLTWFKNHSIVTPKPQTTQGTQASLPMADIDCNNNNNATARQTSEIAQQDSSEKPTRKRTQQKQPTRKKKAKASNTEKTVDATVNENSSAPDAITTSTTTSTMPVTDSSTVNAPATINVIPATVNASATVNVIPAEAGIQGTSWMPHYDFNPYLTQQQTYSLSQTNDFNGQMHIHQDFSFALPLLDQQLQPTFPQPQPRYYDPNSNLFSPNNNNRSEYNNNNQQRLFDRVFGRGNC